MLTQEDTPLRTVTAGKTLTVFLDGDIDHHTARLIRSRIDTKVYIQRPDELILDLSRVWSDSSKSNRRTRRGAHGKGVRRNLWRKQNRSTN